MGMILRFIFLSLVIYLISLVLPGMRLKSFKTAFWVSAVYGLLNFVAFRLLLFITFPLLIVKYLTLGLFGIVLNAILLVITDKILDDFELAGFGTALIAAIGISVANLLLSCLFL